MKVCQLVGYYGYGGVMKVAADLSQALMDKKNGKYDVTYLCRSSEVERSPDHTFRIVELKPRNTYSLWKILEDYKEFDIIHCHDIYALPGLMRRRKRYEEKHVYTHHGIVPRQYCRKSDYPGTLFADRCGKRGIPNTDMNIAISDYIMDVLITKYKSKNQMKIPNGVDLNRMLKIGAEDKDQDYLMDGDPKLLCVSILERQKGQEFLIRSMESIKKQYPKASLTIVGKGRMEGQLRKLVNKLDMGNCVNLVGFVHDFRLYKYYNDCDVLMTPSYWESFGIPIIEGMAFGKPVVTRNAYSMKEHINDSGGGELFDKDDPAVLLDALKMVIDNYNDYSKKARNYSQQFDMDNIIDRHIELYENVIGK